MTDDNLTRGREHELLKWRDIEYRELREKIETLTTMVSEMRFRIGTLGRRV